MADHPFEEVLVSAAMWVAKGATIHQKFTCSGCGSRQTMEKANKVFAEGICEECGHLTDIEKQGCNYTLLIGTVSRPEGVTVQ